MAKTYLAGPSSDLVRVRMAARLLEAHGHELTSRWWESIEAARSGEPSDAGVSDAVLSAAWSANAGAIDEARVVVALTAERRVVDSLGSDLAAPTSTIIRYEPTGFSENTRDEVSYAVAALGIRAVYVVGELPAKRLLDARLRRSMRVFPTVEDAIRAMRNEGRA